MKLEKIKITNYRTLADVEIRFPSFYTAICGKNDSGKTNVVRVLRALAKPESPFSQSDEQVSMKEDFTRWSQIEEKHRRIEFQVDLLLDSDNDTGIFAFILRQLSLSEDKKSLHLKITVIFTPGGTRPTVRLVVDNSEFRDLPAEEVLDKLQSSEAFFFHNSTELLPEPFRRGTVSNLLRDISLTYGNEFESMRQTVNKKLKRISKEHQKQLNELMVRLESKLKVGLAVAPFDFDYLPYNLTLGKGRFDIALDEWGSGTVNTTLILLSLMRAKSVSQSQVSSSKVTPVLIIEEPESFLHPSAQAEFGRILQDLSEELKVQVIATTHSPYMLSMSDPQANILLERKIFRRQLADTEVVSTLGDSWMVPFGIALGLNNAEFEPWKEAFFEQDKPMILVEGDTDREYLDLLRRPEHGSSRLKFPGEILAYHGVGNLQNGFVVKFLRDRCKRLFVTFDLDMKDEVEPKLTKMGFVANRDFLAFGIDLPGKRDIEGLLPESIKTSVRSAHPHLIDQLGSADKNERTEAKARLKKLYLEEFRGKAKFTDEYYKSFYDLAKRINKAMAEMC